MSWITMMFFGPVRFFKSYFQPRVTWKMLEDNRCELVQVTAMLESTREACNTSYDLCVHAMLQGQVEDLEERRLCVSAERVRLQAMAYEQGLIIDRPAAVAC